MPQSKQQARDELEVFKRFVAEARIPILDDSVRCCSPPEPDIACLDVDGTPLGFELTEVIDQKLARNLSFHTDFKTALTTYFHVSLDEARRQALYTTLHNADVQVRLDRGLKKACISEVVFAIFERLMQCTPEDDGCLDATTLPSGVRGMRIWRGRFRGPLFSVSGAQNVGDQTVRQVERKFSKQYGFCGDIELLVHSWTRPLLPDQAWLCQLVEFLESEFERSPFSRVWIFDYPNSTIRFRYPN